MLQRRCGLATAGIALALAGSGVALSGRGDDDYGALRPVPRAQVRITDAFFGPRLERLVHAGLPALLDRAAEVGLARNFERAAAGGRGEHRGGPEADAQLYRLLEALAYALETAPAAERAALRARGDELVAKVVAAQAEDGYLDTHVTLVAPDRRWTDLARGRELYCAAHLMEAGVAYHEATRERALLDAAIRLADHIGRKFGPERGQRLDVPGFQAIELALARLARATGDERYLDLAEFFLDARGDPRRQRRYGLECQDVLPIAKQRTASGHAVRALNMFRALTDVARQRGYEEYETALLTFWDDAVKTKMHVTGGVGGRAEEGGFTDPFALAPQNALCETSASVGMARWNHGMLLFTGHATFGDYMERALYNGVLAGVSLSGDRFARTGPLIAAASTRAEAFADESCAATDLARTLAALRGMVYARNEATVCIGLYVASTAEIDVRGRTVRLEQRTSYPWDGKVDVHVEPTGSVEFAINLRIPGWCTEAVTVGVGDALKLIRVEHGEDPGAWLTFERRWDPGDVLHLELPMDPRRVHPDERESANAGMVSLARGPLVYAFEGTDHGVPLAELALPTGSELEPEWRADVLGGTCVLHATGVWSRRVDGAPASSAVRLTAVPYFQWGNREAGEMRVWIDERAGAAEPRTQPATPDAPSVTVRASTHDRARGLEPLRDGRVPGDGSEEPVPFASFGPRRGTTEWICYDFPSAAVYGGASVYWADAVAEHAPPAAWRLFWWDDSSADWQPVARAGGDFGTAAGCFNSLEFRPVRTRSLKLEVDLADGRQGGVFEWKVARRDGRDD